MNTTMNTLGETLAGLVCYPDGDYIKRAHRGLALAREKNSSSQTMLADFLQLVGHLQPDELEELYTRTFDLNPVSCLDTGWHLHGENYDRGAYMVQIRALLRAFEVEETEELPDHLSHLLTLMSRLEQKDAEEFYKHRLGPSVAKIVEKFEDEENPMGLLLKAISTWLAESFGQEETV